MKELKDYLKSTYGEIANQWKMEKDDRGLFSSLYFLMLEGCEEAENCNSYVEIAMRMSIREDEKILIRIKENYYYS